MKQTKWGIVRLQAEGSNGEKMLPVLETPRGDIFILCCKGDHPLSDSELEQMVGEEIIGQGIVQNNIFIMDSYQIVADIASTPERYWGF